MDILKTYQKISDPEKTLCLHAESNRLILSIKK
ncbi:hypothetical protein CGSSpBS397_05252 [Streptococcus pneumoniae BS397]|nr:hypothetical protein CGSSpBS397_05252 [Streptococcus pneumoniae BS397]